MQGQSIVMYSHGITYADDCLREYLLQNVSGIDIIDITTYNRSLPLKCELSSFILIYYSMYWENFSPLKTIPLKLKKVFPIDIGLGYKVNCSLAVEKFIDEAKAIYNSDSEFTKNRP